MKTYKQLPRPVIAALTLLCAVIMLIPAFSSVFVFAAQTGSYPPAEPSYLTDLRALFCGDSICAAEYYDAAGQMCWGWARRIGVAYGLKTAVNAGVDSSSVSTVRGDNTIVNQLKAHSGDDFDIIVLEGGTNDGWFLAEVGSCTPYKSRSHEDFDISTFAGGLEDLFLTARELYPNALICYFTTYRTPSDFGTLRDMSAYYGAATQICEKWEIPCLDLYSDDDFNLNLWMADEGVYTVDKVHPNAGGYDVLYRVIGDFVNSLAADKGSRPVGGDFDGDGEISTGDARGILRALAGLDDIVFASKAFFACDCDRDGAITSADARALLRISVGRPL